MAEFNADLRMLQRHYAYKHRNMISFLSTLLDRIILEAMSKEIWLHKRPSLLAPPLRYIAPASRAFTAAGGSQTPTAHRSADARLSGHAVHHAPPISADRCQALQSTAVCPTDPLIEKHGASGDRDAAASGPPHAGWAQATLRGAYLGEARHSFAQGGG